MVCRKAQMADGLEQQRTTSHSTPVGPEKEFVSTAGTRSHLVLAGTGILCIVMLSHDWLAGKKYCCIECSVWHSRSIERMKDTCLAQYFIISPLYILHISSAIRHRNTVHKHHSLVPTHTHHSNHDTLTSKTLPHSQNRQGSSPGFSKNLFSISTHLSVFWTSAGRCDLHREACDWQST